MLAIGVLVILAGAVFYIIGEGMNVYTDQNRQTWDEFVGIHGTSEFYDVDGFKEGKCTLLDIERTEVGDVGGKTLLHLQCHFGLDTMSWARLGARVTGMDFSEKAVDLAGSLSRELQIPAEFVCCELDDLPENLSEKYDIIFTSAGVLTWLSDLTQWAELIAYFLKPGGFFYIREFHPVLCMLDDEAKQPELKHPYFHFEKPMRFESTGSYAQPNANVRVVTYEWSHSIGDIINSLLQAGLRLEFFHEFNFCDNKFHPFLEQDKDSYWRIPTIPGGLPMMFSIKAVKQ